MGDTGGLVSFYVARYKRLEDRYIVIDGECNSACTLVLGNAKVCSTDKGMFGFHAASRPPRAPPTS